MARRPIALLVACGLMTMALIGSSSICKEAAAANKSSKAAKKPIRNPKFDPLAEKVDLFEAVDDGQVSVKLIPNDAMGGNVLIENKTDKPLTIKIPDAVVGVSIHAQGFGGGGLGGGLGGGGLGGGGGGGGQAVGGGVGGGGGGLGGGMGGGGFGGGMGGMGGGGFFSVPPEKVISLPFNSVCLEHGKAEPNSGSKYTLIPVSKFSKDAVLYELLTAVGANRVNPQAAQAAAWHLSNNMSFEELAEKSDGSSGALSPSPYFSQEQILGAQRLVAIAAERAADAAEAADKEEETEETADKKSEPKMETRTKSTKPKPEGVKRK